MACKTMESFAGDGSLFIFLFQFRKANEEANEGQYFGGGSSGNWNP